MSNIHASLKEFDDTEKVINSIETPGGNQHVTFLTEKGLYELLFKSRKPIAKIFRNWVFEVFHSKMEVFKKCGMSTKKLNVLLDSDKKYKGFMWKTKI